MIYVGSLDLTPSEGVQPTIHQPPFPEKPESNHGFHDISAVFGSITVHHSPPMAYAVYLDVEEPHGLSMQLLVVLGRYFHIVCIEYIGLFQWLVGGSGGGGGVM